MTMSAHWDAFILNSVWLKCKNRDRNSNLIYLELRFFKLFFSVLNVLVDRLLEDTDLLLRKGFSLDDVLKNLSEKGERNRAKIMDGMNNKINYLMIEWNEYVSLYLSIRACIHLIKISIKWCYLPTVFT